MPERFPYKGKDDMNKKIWDLYAPVYKRAMKADRKVYEFMYDRIPDVIRGKETLLSRVWSGILRIAGVRFSQQWTAGTYLQFLEEHGWAVTFHKTMAARIAIVYAECVRK